MRRGIYLDAHDPDRSLGDIPPRQQCNHIVPPTPVVGGVQCLHPLQISLVQFVHSILAGAYCLSSKTLAKHVQDLSDSIEEYAVG